MNSTKISICKANQAQRDYVLRRFVIRDENARENAIIYVAVNESNGIIGWVTVGEQDVPGPIMGKCWYIHYLFVHKEHRRKGIATALLAEIKRQAEYTNIIYFWGFANPSLEASMFWLNQGATMLSHGIMQNDINKPLYYGNYYHIFSYCILRKALYGISRGIYTRAIEKNEISELINKYAKDESRKTYLLSKADDLFGFVTVSEDNEIKGVILAFPHSMNAPLNSKHWVTNIYVDPQFRHQGIGRSLVWQLYQDAQEKEVIQLTSFTTESDVRFWYELGFDIIFRGKNAKGVSLATAMIRVK